MRGKAQPDGRPALQIIRTPFLLFATCGPKYTCRSQLQNERTRSSWSCRQPL